MEHYFTNSPKVKSQRREIEFKLFNENFKFITDNGVFSKDKLDLGSKILIESFFKSNTNDDISILDIGCGYGVISVIIKKILKLPKITLSDVNKRAIELAVENLKLNDIKDFNIVISDLFEKIKGSFDIIISNPPIRAGKNTIFKLYEDSYNYLNKSGNFYCVIMTKHGAKSTEKKLKEIFDKVECINIEKGYRVYKATK